jgi:hypothetical protein
MLVYKAKNLILADHLTTTTSTTLLAGWDI